jgi:threonine dehydratase
LCKIETLNPIRSFKGRGADYLLHRLAATDETLVAASAGNFGQGLAYACRARGVKAILFAATSANSLKIERMRALGADVRLAGADFDAAKQAARDFARLPGYRFIEDGCEPAIAEGAGTIGVEMSAWPAPIQTLLVPVGNGALACGVGRWLKAVSPQTRIVGVVAEAAPAMRLSWLCGSVVATERADTVADGIAIRQPASEALSEMAGVIDDIVEVSDQQLLGAMRLAFNTLGLIIEPAGAAGLAAAEALRHQLRDSLAATILCGGNVTQEQCSKWLGG